MRPRESSRQRTVLIAGGGVAGLTLANDLASRGIKFRVIDPLPEAVRDSRAHGMLGRTLMALDKLGLAEPMLAASKQPPPIVREYFGNKLVAQTDFATVPRVGHLFSAWPALRLSLNREVLFDESRLMCPATVIRLKGLFASCGWNLFEAGFCDR